MECGKMVVRTKSDIRNLPADATTVRVQQTLTKPMVDKIISRCPGLEHVIVTRKAREGGWTTEPALKELEKREIELEVEEGAGRPVELTRKQLDEIRALRTQGKKLEDIAELVGTSKSTAYRVVKDKLKLRRWREDDYG